MHKIIALWAIPRSTSTAFEWMMRQRGDLDCLHEPFGEHGIKAKIPPAAFHRRRKPQRVFQSKASGPTFRPVLKRTRLSPDFPHYINHFWTPDFLSHFTHAFLIRDPAKTISSMFDKWPDFDELKSVSRTTRIV